MNKRNLLFLFLLIFGVFSGMAQVGIGTKTPDPSALLDLKAEDRGLLIPRVSLTGPTDEMTIKNGNVESLLVYNMNEANGLKRGYYFWNEDKGTWLRLMTAEDTISQPPASHPSVHLNPQSLVSEDASISITNGEGAVLTSAGLSVADQGITSDKIKSGAITTDKIGDKAVTLEKIAPGASNGQVLVTTIGQGGEASLAWKDQEEASVTSLVEEKIQGNGKTGQAGTGKLIYKDENGAETKINAVMPKFFFMPSVAMDVSKPQDEKDLYKEYLRQFRTPMASSTGANSSIPTLNADELEYHITYYDPQIFDNVRVNENGLLTYDVKDGSELTEASFMNIVFVVK